MRRTHARTLTQASAIQSGEALKLADPVLEKKPKGFLAKVKHNVTKQTQKARALPRHRPAPRTPPRINVAPASTTLFALYLRQLEMRVVQTYEDNYKDKLWVKEARHTCVRRRRQAAVAPFGCRGVIGGGLW